MCVHVCECVLVYTPSPSPCEASTQPLGALSAQSKRWPAVGSKGSCYRGSAHLLPTKLLPSAEAAPCVTSGQEGLLETHASPAGPLTGPTRPAPPSRGTAHRILCFMLHTHPFLRAEPFFLTITVAVRLLSSRVNPQVTVPPSS